jgi:hypothetical protein
VKKLPFVIVLLYTLLFSSYALAQHHNGYNYQQQNIPYNISLYGQGWSINLGNPAPPVIYYQQQPIQQAPPVYFVQPRRQLVRVCGPVYTVQTYNGLAYQQNCWQEWR